MDTIDPRTRIGHVHLRVADIERALGFYRDVLGFTVTQWYGRSAVFLAAGGSGLGTADQEGGAGLGRAGAEDGSGQGAGQDGLPDSGYHHHIALNTWQSRGASPPPPGHTGLFHFAILYPTKAALADAFRRVNTAGIPFTGMADHGVSLALYLDDPDGNGVELYWDRPRSEWPRDSEGGLAMYTHELRLEQLLEP